MKHLRDYPAQAKVARKLLQYGLRVSNNRVYCNSIELSASVLARAIGVDRRVVSATVRTISRVKELDSIFSNLLATCHLKDMAPKMGWGVIEIVPTDASKTGILAKVATIIAREGICIRQATVDDPELMDEPRLFVITESMIPSKLIPEIKRVDGVKSITIH